MRKIFISLLVCILFTACCTSCVNAEQENVITLLDGPIFDYSQSLQMQSAISVFKQRNPDYDVRIIHLDLENWKEQMITMLMASGENIDILPTSDELFYLFADLGLLSD